MKCVYCRKDIVYTVLHNFSRGRNEVVKVCKICASVELEITHHCKVCKHEARAHDDGEYGCWAVLDNGKDCKCKVLK